MVSSHRALLLLYNQMNIHKLMLQQSYLFYDDDDDELLS